MFTVWATLAGEQRIESLEETLNYADIQIAIDEVMLNAPEPIRLMEEMAQQIIDRLSNHQSVASISIRIEKPNASSRTRVDCLQLRLNGTVDERDLNARSITVHHGHDRAHLCAQRC